MVQLLEPVATITAVSPAEVVMLLPPFGRTRPGDEWVSVSAPENVRNLAVPVTADDPKPVIVVVPEIVRKEFAEPPISVVVALAIVAVPPPTGGSQRWLTVSM